MLIISGGNKAFRDYMDQYGLMYQTVQKRYSSVAAQYYRDHLKNKIKGNNQKSMLVQQPDYNYGRQRSDQLLSYTKQVVGYSNIQNSKILEDLLQKQMEEQKQSNLAKLTPNAQKDVLSRDLNDYFEDYIVDLEQRNAENVDHFHQLCKHESEIIAHSKNPKNLQEKLQELGEYKESIVQQIDWSLPPYFVPKLNNGQSGQQYGIIEPYSELEDYLDKDDFSNLLNVLG